MATTPSIDQMKAELAAPKRILVPATGPGGVKGIMVPSHMLHGGTKADGMLKINQARAKVYGAENRDPLNIGKIAKIHQDTLEKHFSQPLPAQLSAEQEALSRLKSARHLGSGANGTLDKSEKLDTVNHEHDDQGRTYMGFASKGIAGHALYSSGEGPHNKLHVLNTCPGQTEGCGGGVDAKGIVDTKRGACFAPNAESQYVNAAVRRACHAQAKHDPAMTQDWILAHTGSMRWAAGLADKSNKRLLFRPNVVDETDVSSRHVIRHLNKQRAETGKPPITANSYGKTNELHDPENGNHVTYSNVGPKTKHGKSIAENIARDKGRVRQTIMASDNRGDIVNDDGNPTPPKGSYMVTNVKRGSPMAEKMEKAITHAKYWGTGRPVESLSDEEKAQGPEGHFDGSGKPVEAHKSHYGHQVVGGQRFDYQRQHILHPRLVQVGKNDDGTPHIIPTDSRFKDTEFLPKKRFKSPNGKDAGHLLMTTPTESTSNLQHHLAFNHDVSEDHIQHALKNRGEYEIDPPHAQIASTGKEYVPPAPVQFSKTRKLAKGGSVDDGDDDIDMSSPESSHEVQWRLANRAEEEEHEAHGKKHNYYGSKAMWDAETERAREERGPYRKPVIKKAAGGGVDSTPTQDEMEAALILKNRKGWGSPAEKIAAGLKRGKGTVKEFMTELMKQPGYSQKEHEARGLGTFGDAEVKGPGGSMFRQKGHGVVDKKQFMKLLGNRRLRSEQEGKVFQTTEKDAGSQYEKYTHPGGTNYRTMLLHYGDLYPDEEGPGSKDYVSDHFPDMQNILAHVRLKDRTGPNGEKILHAEEIQSDWHQAARKKGYLDKPVGYKTPEVIKELKALEQARAKIHNERTEHQNAMKGVERMRETNMYLKGTPEDRARMDKAYETHRDNYLGLVGPVMKADAAWDDLYQRSKRMVPDAPHKNDWHELALRHLVKHAAENGYDKVAVTNGEDNAKRYDLSKQVQHIMAKKDGDGFIVFVRDSAGKNHNMGIRSANELPDVVGKEMAEKIASQKKDMEIYEGLDLKVGGEGMKGFYDKMVPTAMAKIVKPFGGKVGQTKIQTNRTSDQLTPREAMEMEGVLPRHIDQSLETHGPSSLRRQQAKLAGVQPSYANLHSIDITPEMRDSITTGGMPAYAHGGEVDAKSIGVNEAPGMPIKAFFVQHNAGEKGLPTGGIDMNPGQPGKQFQPAPPPPQPGQPPQGGPQGAPPGMPPGMPQGGHPQPPQAPKPPQAGQPPQGQAQSPLGMLQMTKPGMTMNAMR